MAHNISNSDFSYIIGFLQGDGNYYKQSRNRGRVSIELSLRDNDILKKISYVLSNYNCYYSERTRDTNFKDDYKSCKLSIYDINFRTSIEEFIHCGKKSNCIEAPIECEWFMPFHYLRGLSDADGSIGITKDKKPFWSICTASGSIKEFVIGLIYDSIGLEKRIERNQRDNVYNISLMNESATKFTKLLYDGSTIHLDRKFERYQNIQNWIRTTPRRKGTKKKWLPYEDILIMNNEYSLEEKTILLNRSESSIKTRIWRNNSNKN